MSGLAIFHLFPPLLYNSCMNWCSVFALSKEKAVLCNCAAVSVWEYHTSAYGTLASDFVVWSVSVEFTNGVPRPRCC